jgi:hypothetical protein
MPIASANLTTVIGGRRSSGGHQPELHRREAREPLVALPRPALEIPGGRVS